LCISLYKALNDQQIFFFLTQLIILFSQFFFALELSNIFLIQSQIVVLATRCFHTIEKLLIVAVIEIRKIIECIKVHRTDKKISSHYQGCFNKIIKMIIWILILLAAYLFYKWGTSTFDYFEKRGIAFNKPKFLVGSRLGMILRQNTMIDFLNEIYYEFPNEK
jgi:hypothetical protein